MGAVPNITQTVQKLESKTEKLAVARHDLRIEGKQRCEMSIKRK